MYTGGGAIEEGYIQERRGWVILGLNTILPNIVWCMAYTTGGGGRI